ncbi:peptidoglycan recognition protein 1-like [Dermochelys coriacea]|uniref:peptidoglycan recognition protein 1-like n=1 Tax=Dermochelys coriacea TaxID=27794 RepID=UPI001CAA217B|nr:peptidoglycan recognition protein 1-like [Dermochelys coriacea]
MPEPLQPAGCLEPAWGCSTGQDPDPPQPQPREPSSCRARRQQPSEPVTTEPGRQDCAFRAMNLAEGLSHQTDRAVVFLCCPRIVSCQQWRAQPPKSRVPLRTPVSYIIIHHMAGNRCYTQASCSWQVRAIQNYHMNYQCWPDIGYNFLIGEDSRVYKGRGWRTRRVHDRNWSRRVPSTAALNTARHLIQCVVSRGFLSRRYTLKGITT